MRDFGAVCSEEAREHHEVPNGDPGGYLTDARRRSAVFLSLSKLMIGVGTTNMQAPSRDKTKV